MPVYKHNGEVYNIPDDKSADFEKSFPDATVSYVNGKDRYDIPISKRDGFMAAFPSATLYSEGAETQQGAGLEEDVRTSFDDEPNLDAITDPKARKRAEKEQKRAEKEERKAQESAQRAVSEGRNAYSSMSPQERSKAFREQARLRDEKYAQQVQMTPEEAVAAENELAEQTSARVQRVQDRINAQSAQAVKPVASPEAIGAPYTQEEVDAAVAEYEALAPGLKDFNTNLAAFNEKYADLENTVKEINEGKRQLTREEYDALAPLYAEYEKESNALSEFSKRYDALLKTGPGREYKEISERMDSLSKGSKTPENAWEYAQEYAKLQRNPIYRASIGGEGPSEDEIQAGLLQGKIEYLEQKLKAVGGGEKMSLSDINASLLPGGHAEKDKVTKDELKKAFTDAKEALYANPWYRKHLDAKQKENELASVEIRRLREARAQEINAQYPGLDMDNRYSMQKTDSEINLLDAAARMRESAIREYKTPTKYDDSRLLKNVGSGVAGWAEGMANDPFGIEGFWEDVTVVRPVLEKVEKIAGNLNQDEIISEGKMKDIEEQLTPGELAVLDAYFEKIGAHTAKGADTAIGYQIGQGIGDMIELGIEMAMTGGVGTAAKKATQKLTKEALMKILGKRAYRKVARNGVGKVALWAMGKGASDLVETAVRIPFMPSTYRALGEGAVEVGSDYKLRDVTEYAPEKMWEQFVEQFTEVSNGFAFPLIGEVAKLPGMQKYISGVIGENGMRAMRAFIERGDIKLLDDMMIGSLGGEWEEEFMGALIHSITDDPNALKDFFSAEQQLVLLGTLAPLPLTRGVAGGVGLAVPAAKADISWRKAEAELKSLGFDEGRIARIKEVMDNAPAPEGAREVIQALRDAGFDRRTAETSTFAASGDGVVNGTLNGIKGSAYDALAHYFWNAQQKRAAGLMAEVEQDRKIEAKRAELESRLGGVFTHEKHSGEGETREVVERCTMIGPDGNPVNIFLTSENFNDSGEKSYVTEDGSRRGFVGINDLGPDYMRTDTVMDVDSYLAQLVMQDSQVQEAQEVMEKATVENRSLRRLVEAIPELKVKLNGKTGTLTNPTEDGATFVPDDESEGNVVATWAELAEQNGIAVPEVTTPAEDAQVVAMAEAARYQQKQDIADGFTAAMESNADLPPEVDTVEGHGVVTGIVSDTVDPEAGTAQFTVLLDDGRRSVTTAIPIDSILSQITPAPAPEVPAEAPVEAPAEEPVETVEEEPETKVEIPVDKKGNPIYDAPGVSVEDALDAMYDTTGLTEEQALQYIDSVNKYIEKRAEEAEKGRAVKQGKMSLPELKQAIIEANRVADFWKAAKDAIAPMVRGMQRDAELRKKIESLGGVHPNDLAPRTMEEALAAGLAGFFNSGYRLNRKSVLDLIGHDKGNDLAKNGYSFVVSNKPGSIPVDKFVMDIADEYPDLIKDEQDAINMVEQLLRSKTRGELGNFILEARQKELADAAAAAEGTLNLDEMTVEKLTDGKFKVGDRVMFPVKIDGETVMAEATIAGVDPENEGNILVTDDGMQGVTTSVRATTVKAKEAEEAPEEAPEQPEEPAEAPTEAPAEEPKEDEGEEEEEKVVLEDEEGTPGNFHWPSERVCTNPIIITLPGQDRKGAVNKVAIAEKDGKWYFSTYVRADAEKGSSWGNVIPTFRANYIAYGSREEALKKAADYIRFLVEERERKIDGKGIKESFNDAKALADQIDPPKGGPESPVKPEKTETKEEKAERKRVEKLTKRADKWKEKLGDVFTVLTSREDVEGIEDEKAKEDVLAALDRGERVGGFYRKGKAYIYLPGMYDDLGRGLTDEQVLDRAIMHEVITHKGLEGLLGKERFAKLCDDVWNNIMDEADQADWLEYVGDGFKTEEGRRRAAANEFMAHAAEESALANELDKTKWQKFVDFVKKAIEDLFGKDFFGKDMSFFDQLLRESMNRFVLENGKDGALGRLSDRYVAANEEEALFSRRFAPTKAQEKGVVDDIVKALGISRAQAKRWVQTETSLAALVGDEVYGQYLDYEADDRYEAIKKDSDYPQGTVDFNNICRKRLAFTRMYQRLQKAFPNTIITGEDLATIRQIMKDHNLTVACGLCYVEDRRQLLGEIAVNFINEMKGGFENYAKGSETKQKNAEKFRNLLGEDKKEDLSIYDLITLSGSTKLSEEHPGIYAAFQAFNAARGQQAGNLFQGYAEYKREILKWSKAKVASVNANGGLRVFSYSDFEAHHLIDLVQIIQDCARMGVMIQGYTKVPAFARAVANTGIKLNRSLIPLGDTGIVDGKLAYDPVEGIDVNDKDFLESNDNIGNILIGINDEQIRLAMADPFVHYIIPYHSNQSGVLRKMKQTGAWTNYKNEQTEKGENVGKHGVNIYTDVLAAAEKEGKPIKNEKQFVEKFLAVCKEKGWTPRFARFLNTNEAGEYVYTPGYYKLLLDFKLFDEKGRILPQKPVKADFDDAFLKTILEDYVKDEQEKYEGDLDAVYDEIVETLGLEEREEDVTHFSKSRPLDPETEKLFDAAKKHFGTTRMLSEAGYALPDGTMLDFSGRHWASGDTSWLNGRRQVDHRDIHELNYEEDGNTPSGFKTDMPDFIRRGAVRLNGYAINLANKPTRQQEDIIRSVIYRANGDVDVDFGDGYNSDHYVSYERVSPSRVINDIRSYFDDGVKPEGNTMFSKNNANQAIFVSNAASALAKVKMDKATPAVSVSENASAEEIEEGVTMFSKVTDQKIIDWFNKAPKTTGFRTVAKRDVDEYGSPMAGQLAQVKGKAKVATSPFRRNEIEQAEENPDIADENGKVRLVKPKRKGRKKLGDVPSVDYNPYIHLRLDKINRQFKNAWERDDLIYIESEVPIEEVPDFRGEKNPDYSKSPYRAEKAALPVGIHDWNGGALMLSRYDRPIREVPWDEVADAWAADEDFKQNGVHFDIVPPQMRDLLTERGIKIIEPHKNMGKACNDAYEQWKNGQSEPAMFSRGADIRSDNFKKFFGDWENDPDNASKVVNEDGTPMVVYHGSRATADFDSFDYDADTDKSTGSGEKPAFFFTDEKSATTYSKDVGLGTLYKGDGRIVPAYLSIRKPMVVDYDGANFRGVGLKAEFYSYVLKKWMPVRNTLNGKDLTYFATEGEIIRQYRENRPNSGRIELDKDYRFTKVDVMPKIAEVVDGIDRSEYDGAIIKNIWETGQAIDDYVAFDSKQIKHATENNGEYNPDDERIRFSKSTENLSNPFDRAKALTKLNGLSNNIGVGFEQDSKMRTKGGFDSKTGKVRINVDAHKGTPDLEATLLHEAVAHEGLDKLSSNSWRKDCSDIYGQLPESVKSAVDAIAETDRLSANVAMEKYIATLAEEGVTNNEEASVRQKVVDAVKNILARLGFDPDYYTEADFRAMLYGSYANQQRGGALETAERAETYNALRNGAELSHNEGEDNGPDDNGPDGGIPFDETESEDEPTETDTESLSENERDAVVDNEDATMFSRARRRAISATAADVYETRAANVWQNARAQLVDEFQPLIDFLRAVLNENAVDKKGRRNPYARTLEGLKDDERVVEMLRELPGKAMRENERYNEEFSRPMWNALGMFRKAVLKAGEQCSLDDMVKYVMLKSGIERNIQFAKRDAKRTHQKAYDARIAEINEQEKERQKKLDKDLKDGKISDVTYASKTAALQAEKKLKRDEAEAKRQANFANVDAGTDGVFLENREKDYSGLMTWFQEDSGLKREDFPSTPAYNRAVAAARATYVSGVTDLASAETEAQNYVNRMEGLAGRQNADELWKRINAATKETLEFQYRHDMITRQQRDDIASTMKYYVPMRGFADETAEDLYSYYMTSNTSGFAPTVLAAKGRTTRSENPFGMIGFMHGSAVAQGMKNQAKLGLLNFVRRHPDNGIATVTRAWFVKNGQQDADGKDLYDVRYPDIPEGASFDDRQAILDQFEQDMKQLREQGDAYNSHREVVMNNGVVAFEKESHKNEHIVKVYEGGKEYGVIFSGNPAAAQAVNGLTKRKADDYLAAYDGIRRGMSGMFTTYSPLFWITNFQRDTGQGFENAFIRNSIKYFGTYTKSWFRSILRVLPLAAGWEKMDAAALGKLDPKIADYYKEFVENGGPMGQTRISGNEYYERKMKRYIRRHQYDKANFFNACGAVLNAIGSVGEAIETLTRFTAFVASRESGRPLHQSISDAKEISTNFARRGRRSFTWDEIRRMEHMNGRKLNKVEAGAFQLASWMVGYFRHNTIFFNAAMQGIDNLRVNFANNPLKTSLVLGMYAALAFALKFWHSGDGDDDEKGQYGHTSDYLRRNNLLVPLGDGRYMKIALPQEYRWAYGFGDVMASAFMHDRPADELVDDFFTSFMEMLPVGVFADNVGLSHSLAPSIVTPWLEVKENKNFMGSRLYNEGFNGNAKDDPGWTKAIPSTGIGYVKLAEYLNRVTGGGENNDVFRGDIDINPAILEHIVEGYLSGPMQIVNGVSSAVRSVATGEEMKTRDKLFVNRLILDTHDNDKDAYYNDLYYYFKEFDKEAKRIDAKLKERTGEGSEQVDKFYASKMYRYMMVFKEYESEERSINKRKKGEDEEDIKAANDRSLEIHRDIATRCMEIYLEDED